jgi:hypothetical protein
MDDVVRTAWAAAGRPAAGRSRGSCARCGGAGRTTAVRELVSGNFTAWDGWVDPSGRGLCGPCAWAYREPCLRALPTLVRAAGPAMAHPRRGDLAGLLSCPAEPGAVLIIPLRPGRKHLLPEAQWGRVVTDDAALPWGPADVARLQAMLRLRQAGFGTRMLAAAAPAYPVLRRLPAGGRTATLADWDLLRDWRARPPWLRLAAYVTTPASLPGPGDGLPPGPGPVTQDTRHARHPVHASCAGRQ